MSAMSDPLSMLLNCSSERLWPGIGGIFTARWMSISGLESAQQKKTHLIFSFLKIVFKKIWTPRACTVLEASFLRSCDFYSILTTTSTLTLEWSTIQVLIMN